MGTCSHSDWIRWTQSCPRTGGGLHAGREHILVHESASREHPQITQTSQIEKRPQACQSEELNLTPGRDRRPLKGPMLTASSFSVCIICEICVICGCKHDNFSPITRCGKGSSIPVPGVWRRSDIRTAGWLPVLSSLRPPGANPEKCGRGPGAI